MIRNVHDVNVREIVHGVQEAIMNLSERAERQTATAAAGIKTAPNCACVTHYTAEVAVHHPVHESDTRTGDDATVRKQTPSDVSRT